VSATDLEVMRRLDRLHLEFPFAGSRMLRGLLVAEGCKIGRRHGKTLMQRIGVEALYRRPRTTKPEPGHKIYPYLLRATAVTRPNQVWAMDITYIPMARGFVYLAVVLDWFSRRVLSWRLSITMEAAFCVATLEDALARHGKPPPGPRPSGAAGSCSARQPYVRAVHLSGLASNFGTDWVHARDGWNWNQTKSPRLLACSVSGRIVFRQPAATWRNARGRYESLALLRRSHHPPKNRGDGAVMCDDSCVSRNFRSVGR
jgi:transposase InsO family protein